MYLVLFQFCSIDYFGGKIIIFIHHTEFTIHLAQILKFREINW